MKEELKWFGKECEYQIPVLDDTPDNDTKYPLYIKCCHVQNKSPNCAKGYCPLDEGWL